MYYNYIYLDPRKECKLELSNICLLYEPIYVGKGIGKRHLKHLEQTKRVDNIIFKNKINKILRECEEIFIIQLNYTPDETISYQVETELIKEIGSNYINEIKNGSLCNVCLENSPPNHKGKTYKEIYGDRWKDEVEKRNKIQQERGGFFKGHTHTDESRKKISESITGDKNPMYGKNHSEESLKKMRETKLGMFDGSDNPNSKAYIAYSPNDEIYKLKGNVKEFCKDNELSYSTLRNTIKSGNRVSKGRTKGWLLKYE